ncbi:Potassium uptake protein, TrkH family [Candidatus Zixiibacteriota bacterium]|nr:Potassium uptake protein, TrkH family [candidate division Zixibacteria bacterium]
MKKAFYKLIGIRPGLLMLLAYLFVITSGSLILLLPSCRTTETSFLDSFFTCTSAVCVTGLITVNTATVWTFWGHLTILLLIQLGGLGIMTIATIVFISAGRRISAGERLYFEATVAVGKFHDVFYLLKRIFIFTFALEMVGTFFLTIGFMKYYDFPDAFWYGVFHAVSAFNNAGFSLFSSNLQNFSGDIIVNLTAMAMIILGGLGYFVMIEMTEIAVKRKRRHLSLHTKSVLIVTACLILFGALALYSSGKLTLLDSFFQSVTARTAGFNTVDIAALPHAAVVVLMVLMFIGASPGSTGGGIKTTSFLLVLQLAISRLRGHTKVTAFHRTIPTSDIIKSVAVFTLGILIVTAVSAAIVVFQSALPITDARIFRDAVFETISAFGTVGLSLGITPYLTGASKIAIIITMLIGKVGLLTIAYSLAAPKGRRTEVIYAEENVMIG